MDDRITERIARQRHDTPAGFDARMDARVQQVMQRPARRAPRLRLAVALCLLLAGGAVAKPCLARPLAAAQGLDFSFAQRPVCVRQASAVWRSRMALVTEPTPRGTGVIAPALGSTASKSTSPQIWPSRSGSWK